MNAKISPSTSSHVESNYVIENSFCFQRISELNGIIDPNTALHRETPITVVEMFHVIADRHHSRPALLRKHPGATEWKLLTYHEYWNNCRRFAKSILHLGIDMHKVANILGFNSPEWFIANIGTIFAGCVSAGLYPTSSPENCAYISSHCEAQIVCVDSVKHFKKFAEIQSRLPLLRAIIQWGEPIDQSLASSVSIPVYSWEEFIRLGESSGITDDALNARQSRIRPGHCASLIYTSGTTGIPKAVMLSHDNITWNFPAHLYVTLLKIDPKPWEQRVVSFLPLNHIAAQTLDMYGMAFIGGSTYFAQKDALEGSLLVTLKEVKPTTFMAVPGRKCTRNY